jgi:hypothetical protein
MHGENTVEPAVFWHNSLKPLPSSSGNRRGALPPSGCLQMVQSGHGVVVEVDGAAAGNDPAFSDTTGASCCGRAARIRYHKR